MPDLFLLLGCGPPWGAKTNSAGDTGVGQSSASNGLVLVEVISIEMGSLVSVETGIPRIAKTEGRHRSFAKVRAGTSTVKGSGTHTLTFGTVSGG